MSYWSPYLDHLEQDAVARQAVEPSLAALNQLTAEQLETVVFYLKSLHSDHPESSWATFETKLRSIRDGAVQVAMQNRGSRLILGSILISAFAGVLLLLALLVWHDTGLGSLGLLLAALALFWTADRRLAYKALVLAKDQDRQYFLTCLRTAKTCRELEQCGLFCPTGERSEPLSDERIGELARDLRSALYRDEVLRFVPNRLSPPAPETRATV